MTFNTAPSKSLPNQVILVLVAFAFSIALGQLLLELLMITFHGASYDWLPALPSLAFSVLSCSIVITRQLSRFFIMLGLGISFLLLIFLHLEFWQAALAGLACALPLLYLDAGEVKLLSNARFVHHLHNLQQLTILCGMSLSLWHEPLRLPVLLSIFGGMAQWNRHVVNACPFTILEARLTKDRQKAAQLLEVGYFRYYLRQWTGWPITRPQLIFAITVLITSMLGQWVLV